MRVQQPSGTRGSLKWLQIAVNQAPDLVQPPDLPRIEWLSPLATDSYAEYRDRAFLDRLGLGHLGPGLEQFWPKRGPQWDALGMTAQGPVLVEAKAHLREFFSPPTQSRDTSRQKIEEAFNAVQTDMGISSSTDWTRTYYQYANRIAHLWWLRQRGINAALLFVSFLNDDEMGGPKHAESWGAAFASANYALGLTGANPLLRHVVHLTPDVRQMQAP